MQFELHQIVEGLSYAVETVPQAYAAERQMAHLALESSDWIELRAKRMRRVLAFLDGFEKRVLDAGCGNGLNAVLAIYCGAREVIAVEIDPVQSHLAACLIDWLGLQDRIFW